MATETQMTVCRSCETCPFAKAGIVNGIRRAGKRNYAKQSQFLKTEDERKPLWKKGLRKRTAPRAPQKQTQIKPISDYPCVFELAVYNLVLRDGNVMHSMPNGRDFDGEYMK